MTLLLFQMNLSKVLLINCNSVIDNVADNDDDAIIEFYNQINSKYLDIDHLNKLRPNPLSSFNIIHNIWLF